MSELAKRWKSVQKWKVSGVITEPVADMIEALNVGNAMADEIERLEKANVVQEKRIEELIVELETVKKERDELKARLAKHDGKSCDNCGVPHAYCHTEGTNKHCGEWKPKEREVAK